jgi:hypothetical protein
VSRGLKWIFKTSEPPSILGTPYADAASMLCRDEDEVRQKAKELGLIEHRKKW